MDVASMWIDVPSERHRCGIDVASIRIVVASTWIDVASMWIDVAPMWIDVDSM